MGDMMSASLDYGIEFRPIVAPGLPSWKHKKRRNYKKNRELKVQQFYRDFPNCYYCGEQLNKSNRSLDHFVPRSFGGNSSFVNLVTACQKCNNDKGDQLPTGMKSVPKNLLVEDVGKQELALREIAKHAPVDQVIAKQENELCMAGVEHVTAWELT